MGKCVQFLFVYFILVELNKINEMQLRKTKVGSILC